MFSWTGRFPSRNQPRAVGLLSPGDMCRCGCETRNLTFPEFAWLLTYIRCRCLCCQVVASKGYNLASNGFKSYLDIFGFGLGVLVDLGVRLPEIFRQTCLGLA